MKKKILCLVLGTLMATSLVACGGSKDSAEATDATEKNIVEKAVEKVKTVDVTVPAAIFEGEDGEDAQENIDTLTEEAKAAGVKDVVKNEDGSVTMTMTEEAQEKLLEEMKTEIDSGISDILNDKENYPSIHDITYNDDMTDFTLTVDRGFEEGFEQFVIYALFLYGDYYQIFNGVPHDQLKTIATYVDQSTGESYYTIDSTQLEEESTE